MADLTKLVEELLRLTHDPELIKLLEEYLNGR